MTRALANKGIGRGPLLSTSETSAASNIPTVTAVAEMFPDGQRITKAVLEFSSNIENGVIDASKISVKDRIITNVEVSGKTVTLDLSIEDEAAIVLPNPSGPPPKKKEGEEGPPKGEKKRMIPARIRRPVKVVVSLPGIADEIESTKTLEPIVDDFTQGEYKGIKYNLFVPKDYSAGKKYPIVMFIPDASANGADAKLALVQGIGATCWATPEEQAKNPCFVLAVEIPKEVHLTNNEHVATPEIEIVKELLDKTVEQYGIDKSRIYTTGQSQGCMASCELNVRYPDYFAASMIVSGHWDVAKMAKLTNNKFFIGLSEGGLREYPNMNEICDALEANGVEVSRVRLNFRDGKEINNAKIREAAAGGAPVVYIIFDVDTAFPDDGKERPMIAHHARGWELTYDMEAARDWLMSQKL